MGRWTSTAALLAAAFVAAPAAASADIPVVDKCNPMALEALQTPPGGPMTMTPNVEYVGTVPGEGGDLEPGGRLVGHYFYVTGSSHFSIYDVANPLKPKLMSRLEFPCRFENEDVAVNGDILMWSDFGVTGDLFVYDVRDKAHPKLASDTPGAGTHTMECVDGCRYGFGSYHAVTTSGPLRTGEVVDLLDPTHPKVLGDWTDNGVLPSRNNHDTTEVAPNRLPVAAAPVTPLRTSASITKPKVIAQSDTDPAKRYHTVIWPRGGTDRFVLATYETNGTPRCEAGVGDLSTFDTTGWQSTKKLKLVDSYHLVNGTGADGNPPANTLGCSPHWINVRPSWSDGGVVALGAYDNGTKFLRVDGAGKITEIGSFLPPGTQASGAYWISCDIVYVVDYARGVDILRLNDPGSSCPAGAANAGADAAASPGAPVSEQPPLQQAVSRRSCASRRRFRIRLRLPRGIHRADVGKATIRVGSGRLRVLRGKRLTAPVDLRGLPPNRFTVRVRLTLKDGRTVAETRRYRTCAPRR